MPNYLRPDVPGATIFFTVALAERGSDLLVREIDRLRDAVQATRNARPFGIDAWVVLPDHLHCVWTLPDSDADFSTRCVFRDEECGTRRNSGWVLKPGQPWVRRAHLLAEATKIQRKVPL
ncbi:MAG TPA: hypothetical protein VMY41_06295 [Thermohalobaculum sp.]|nr:hypothetical protein [Thermohalobaculum sp.]